jgi:hypothetical protein
VVADNGFDNRIIFARHFLPQTILIQLLPNRWTTLMSGVASLDSLSREAEIVEASLSRNLDAFLSRFAK